MVFVLRADRAAAPLYQQIRDGLRGEIMGGALQAGARLPASRQLARDLGVSRITVVNAYAELEAEGLLESRGGAGTFVLAPWEVAEVRAQRRPRVALPRWQAELAPAARPQRARALREDGRPIDGALISFARARGDSRPFPVEEFRRTLGAVVEHDRPGCLEYEHAEGYPPLRDAVARYLRQLGVDASADDVVITAGAQQAIDLLARVLVRPGDTVAIEEPTYPGALDAFETAGAWLVPVPLDREGMRVDVLRGAIEGGARLVYTVPTFHNPTGAVMSAQRRHELVALAQQLGVPVIEDDYLREVRFGSPIPPPLAAFDQHGDVVHVGSFSKSLLPTLRLGYVVVRGPLREQLVALKRVADAGSSALLQRALHSFLQSGVLHRHWKRASRLYRRRQAAMVAAMRRHFPAGARWTAAGGGVLMWVRVPDGVSVDALWEEAIAHGVGFAPGSAFFVEPADQPFIRLNFAALDDEQIERGVATIGRLMAQRLAARPIAS